MAFDIELYCQALMDSPVEYDTKIFGNLAENSSLSEVLKTGGTKFIKQHQAEIKSWNQHSNEFHAWVCLLHFGTHFSIPEIFDASSGHFEELLEPRTQNLRIRLNTLKVLLSLIREKTERIPDSSRSRLVKIITKNLIFQAGRIETGVRLLAGN